MLRKLSNGFRWLLWPFSFLYGAITYIRNYLYNNELIKIYQSAIYSINIGNLTVGGTGKTPHIEYLQRLLNSYGKIAILSRGYGRKTKGYLAVTSLSTAADVGDEPLQFYKKSGHQTAVVVCEQRAEGLKRIEEEKRDTQIVLLDDAFQHRAVRAHLNLLLTDFGRLFYKDYLLPTGLLRESRYGAQRADAVIVTKCPASLSEKDKNGIKKQINRYTLPDTPVFFSSFAYETPKPYFEKLPILEPQTPVWLVSGIAQPRNFEAAAAEKFRIAGHSALGDHHDFKEEEIRNFVKISRHSPILTTEKDWVKIRPLLDKIGVRGMNFYYWPIQVKFDSPNFDHFILNEAVKRFPV